MLDTLDLRPLRENSMSNSKLDTTTKSFGNPSECSTAVDQIIYDQSNMTFRKMSRNSEVA